MICLKNPGMSSSVSAFCSYLRPYTQVPWGEKAFQDTLDLVEAGKEYDASELVKNYFGPKPNIFFDQELRMVPLYNQ